MFKTHALTDSLKNLQLRENKSQIKIRACLNVQNNLIQLERLHTTCAEYMYTVRPQQPLLIVIEALKAAAVKSI